MVVMLVRDDKPVDPAALGNHRIAHIACDQRDPVVAVPDRAEFRGADRVDHLLVERAAGILDVLQGAAIDQHMPRVAAPGMRHQEAIAQYAAIHADPDLVGGGWIRGHGDAPLQRVRYRQVADRSHPGR